MDLDGQVARHDSPVAEVLDKFVCVRIVQGWGLDLSLFQFDFDMTWAAFFLNADRTIYGRYGSRSSRDAEGDVSLAGFRKAAEASLELHGEYPANKKALAAKTGAAPAYPTPEKIPQITGHVVKADGSRAGCLHCHDVSAGTILTLHHKGTPVPDELLWAFPMPDVVGLHLDTDERARVTSIEAESPAARAGFKPGDDILSMAGQPVVSIADVQWVMQHTREGEVAVRVQREGKTTDLTLTLPQGWRRKADFSWRSPAWPLRFRVAGLSTEPLDAEAAGRLGLKKGTLALRIARLSPNFVKFRNPAPSQLGLRAGDVIVGIDGKTEPMRECDFLAYLVQHKKPGGKVRLTILRGGNRQTVEMKVQ